VSCEDDEKRIEKEADARESKTRGPEGYRKKINDQKTQGKSASERRGGGECGVFVKESYLAPGQ